MVGMGCDDENRPKQCIWYCLGHRYVVSFFLHAFYMLTNNLYYVEVI